MKKVYALFGLFISWLLLTGCNSYDVRPLAFNSSLQTVYVEHNPEVIIGDFEDVLVSAIRKSGLIVEVVNAPAYSDPSSCTLRYTARRSWDIVPYLTYANIEIYQGSRLRAFGTYRHIGGSCSLSLFKWQGTEAKMVPLYEELFEAYKPF